MKKKSEGDSVIIYTDGSSIGNPGPGGYAAILTFKGREKTIKNGFKLTTNNRMELMAVIEGLKALKKKNLCIKLVSDSKYVLEAIEKGWVHKWKRNGFKKKKNADLWNQFLAIEKDYKIKCNWIKGHNGHIYNERCDEIANYIASNNPTSIDDVYENFINAPKNALFK